MQNHKDSAVDELLIVGLSYAIIQPVAMMIKLMAASIASPAMF